MKATDILEDLEKRPFVPLRFFVADGTVYDIRHPEQCVVGLHSIVVGVPGPAGIAPYERLVRIGCEHVVRIEPIQLPVAGNGQPPPA